MLNRETDYAALLETVKSGRRLPPATLQHIKNQLRSGEYETDLYTLLHILGRSGDADAVSIMQSYSKYGLGSPDDDGMVRRLVTQMLARQWNAPDYFDAIAETAFADPSPYVRDVAATAIGHYGARYPRLRRRAAALLLKGLGANPYEDETRESFYYGLLELFDVPPREWPNAARRLAEQDIRRDLIRRAKSVADAADVMAQESVPGSEAPKKGESEPEDKQKRGDHGR